MQEVNREQEFIALLSTVFNEIPFNKTLGIRIVSLSHEESTVSFESREEHVGNFLKGILHGGVISSILDATGGIVAMASIIHRNLNTEKADLAALIGKCSTIDLNINYLRPGRGEIFTAKGYMIKSGSKISFTRMEFIADNGELVAIGTGTFSC